MNAPLPPAGWYDDGSTPGVLRWFDGTDWTEHTRSVAPPAPTPRATVPQPSAAPAFAWQAAALQPSAAPTFAPQPTALQPAAAPAFAPEPAGWSTGLGASSAVVGGQLSGFGQQPTYAQQPTFGQPVGFGQQPAYGQPVTWATGPSEAALKGRRRALRNFWAAVGVLLVFGGIYFAMDVGDHKIVRFSGFTSAAIFLFRSYQSYRPAVREGATPFTTRGCVLGSVALAIGVLVAVGGMLHAFVTPSLPAPVAGSCWSEITTNRMDQVACESEHDYRASAVVTAQDRCEVPVDDVLDLEDGTYLCLVYDTVRVGEPA